MNRITLNVRSNASIPVWPVNASQLTPDALMNMDRDQIGAITLQVGRDPVALNKLFSISVRDSKTPALVIKPGELTLDELGRSMTSGHLHIKGNAGNKIGVDMRDGLITVDANCGAMAGTNMRGGKIHIKGNAGERTAGNQPGHPFGMRGGVLQVDGNCGPRTGDRMRRGIVLIGGDAGDHCAHRMLAGTIIVSGRVGKRCGFEMRHGTLIVLDPTQMAQPQLGSFADTGSHPLMFMRLLARTVRAHRKDVATRLMASEHWQRLAGDLAAAGRGEILLPAK